MLGYSRLLIFFLVFGVVPSRDPKKAILTEFRKQNVTFVILSKEGSGKRMYQNKNPRLRVFSMV